MSPSFQACDSNCSTCSDSASTCTGCLQGLFLKDGVCISSCPDHFYENCSSATCSSCDSNCLTCYGPESANCASCEEGKYLQDSACREDCDAGFLKNTSTSNCDACSTSCATCAGSTSNCTSCATNWYLNIVEGSPTECVESCGEGLFISLDGLSCTSKLRNQCLFNLS